MSLSEMFHVGIVVADLGAGRARFTELLGIEWGPIIEGEIEIRDGDGNDLVVPNRICYSTRAPYLELIQEVRGTPWVCNEHSNLHHIGFFSDALVADSAGLSAAACPLELLDGHGDALPARGRARDGRRRFDAGGRAGHRAHAHHASVPHRGRGRGVPRRRRQDVGRHQSGGRTVLTAAAAR
jgi:hypothetical protein